MSCDYHISMQKVLPCEDMYITTYIGLQQKQVFTSDQSFVRTTF